MKTLEYKIFPSNKWKKTSLRLKDNQSLTFTEINGYLAMFSANNQVGADKISLRFNCDDGGIEQIYLSDAEENSKTRKGNPIMKKPVKKTTRKPATPAQLAARKKFAEMAKARKSNPKALKMKIKGTETLDNPEGLIVTEAGALRFAKSNMPNDLKKAGFVPSVKRGEYGDYWVINYGKKVNSRHSNPSDIHIDIGSHNTKGRNVRAKNPAHERYVVTATGKNEDGSTVTLYYARKDIKRGILVFTDTLSQAKIWNDRRDATMARTDIAQFTAREMVKPHPIFKVKKLGN